MDRVKVLKATLDDIAQDFVQAIKFRALLVTTAKVRRGAEKYANYYGIIIEKLPHSKSFAFKYENIISVGQVISAGRISVNFLPKLLRRCEKRGKQFEQISEEKMCSACTTTGNID